MLARTPLYGQQGPLRLGFRATLEEWFPQGSDKELKLGVECKNIDGNGIYEVVLKYGPSRQLQIIEERASWKGRGGEAFSYDSSRDTIQTDHRGAILSSSVPRGSTLGYLFHQDWLRDPKLQQKITPLYTLMSCFAPFYVYRFSPSAIARPAEVGDTVSHDGMGLPAELDQLLGADRSTFDKLVQKLNEVFPHIKQVNVVTIKQDKSGKTGAPRVLKGLTFETVNGVKVPAELESDGVLLTLAFLWLSTKNAMSIGVEEPETATYPSLLKSRWQILNSMSKGSAGNQSIQVIATSHSPTLLTYIGDSSCVRVFEIQSDGTSKIRTSSLPMGDLIYRELEWSVHSV